ncbi:MAG TPA: pyruvate kinase [Candidatus Saccharimonadales bacterium]|jgi:pyruvate kinase|nr:pyruvate kinase [Candidatus Saccharimonadales bacterium]
MKQIDAAPKVPLANFKRTKMIATVGPSTDSYEAVLELVKAGVNGLRLNFSHGTHESHGRHIKWARKAGREAGKPVAVIQDLQGPKIRLGDFNGIINVNRGQGYAFAYGANYTETGRVPTQYDLAKKVKRGERMYIYDGRVRFTITSAHDGIVHAEAENDGILIKRKGINLPDTDFGGDIITAKDRADLIYGSAQDIDYVALSFVQTADDIIKLKQLLKNMNSSAKVIAKVETKAAVENIEEIVKASDAVMVARGDLAVETAPESVPIVQRQIIGLGLKYAKPTIVATQMLASMSDFPEPTRAEVSDIATAVLVGADCVMLSDETASGKYPLESVKMMKRVIVYTEQNSPLSVVFADNSEPTKQGAISKAVINLAEDVDAAAIIAETKSGATALQIASRRPTIPLIAVTSDIRTAQQLSIVFGTKSYNRPVDPQAAVKLTDWLRQNKLLRKGDIVVTASGRHPGVVGTTDTIKIRVLE